MIVLARRFRGAILGVPEGTKEDEAVLTLYADRSLCGESLVFL